MVRLHPSDGENAQGRGFTFLPFLHDASPTFIRTIERFPKVRGKNQAAINNRWKVGWQLFLSPA
ncbi:hypothetical protein B4914_06650 [Yersinia entomophaga]|nr:hypothetical protein B4914_06650 [Yersinia entomophaga]